MKLPAGRAGHRPTPQLFTAPALDIPLGDSRGCGVRVLRSAKQVHWPSPGVLFPERDPRKPASGVGGKGFSKETDTHAFHGVGYQAAAATIKSNGIGQVTQITGQVGLLVTARRLPVTQQMGPCMPTWPPLLPVPPFCTGQSCLGLGRCSLGARPAEASPPADGDTEARDKGQPHLAGLVQAVQDPNYQLVEILQYIVRHLSALSTRYSPRSHSQRRL